MVTKEAIKITKKEFGKTKEGQKVQEFKLENIQGAYITVLDYGCTLTSINVYNKDNNLVDVCLGYNTIEEYEKNDGYLGAVVGRHANRIKEGKFKLNEKEYNLFVNNGPNHLHGGGKGFDKYVWDCEIKENKLIFTRESKHMEEGYPGNLTIKVSYEFNDNNELIIDYFATTDEDTIVNLTNHCYFNLNGESSGTILNHTLDINSLKFTENDSDCLPTGVILDVENTPFDFREAKQVGRDIVSDYIQLVNGKGYDHNFIIDSKDELKYVGTLEGDISKIQMKTYTTCPGVQFYSGNFLDGAKGKGETNYNERYGMCLETQYFPNAMECTNFPSIVLKKGEEFKEKTLYKFTK